MNIAHGSQPKEPELILAPAFTAKRKLPLNFKESDRELFAHELTKEIPETKLLELTNVRAGSEGILTKGGKILRESFAFPSLFEEWKTRSRVKVLAGNYVFRKQRRIDNDALWIVDEWSGGYFHWLCDALTRLYMVRDRLEHLTLLLPQQYERLDFVQASLRAFAVPRVEFIKPGEVLLCRRLFLPTHTAPSGHFRVEPIRGVSNLLRAAYGASAGERAGRFYISRGKTKKRRIVNEPEVLEVLAQFGFQNVYAEDHPFKEQVAIASRVKYFVSNHGAGLTNMLFMPAGGSVLELRHGADDINNCYFTMASALDLNYFFQGCEPVDPHENAHTAYLRVDSDKLKSNIELMLRA